MQITSTWRDFLRKIIQDSQERQRIANELNVNPVTLMRWVNNESKPRPQNLRQLLNILPQHRSVLFELITEEFPEVVMLAKSDVVEDQSQEIPSEFYARVLNAYAATPQAQRFWAISNLILQQALGQLDPNHVGMALTVVQCVPPLPGNKVRSLRESTGRGTPPWTLNLEQQPIFLGVESLAGYAVTACRPIVIQNPEERGTFPAHWVEWEQSAAAYPLMRVDSSAGCLLVSCTQPDYFLPARRTLIQNYAALLLLAFEPEEFFEIQNIDLQPMPFYRQQEKYLSNFRQRVATVMLEAMQKQQPINVLQAELSVWQQFEEELLKLPPYIGE